MSPISAPFEPTADLVAAAWLVARVPELTEAMVATTLPKDPASWPDGFVQAVGVSGVTHIDVPLRRSIVQVDTWAAKAGSNKPLWNLAAVLGMSILRATEGAFQRDQYGKPLTLLIPNYKAVRVQAVYPLNDEPHRVPGDPSGYARYTQDLEFDWLPL